MKFATMSPASFARESGRLASFNDRQYKIRSLPFAGRQMGNSLLLLCVCLLSFMVNGYFQANAQIRTSFRSRL